MRAGWPSPNLAGYDAARAKFSWQTARALLDGLPGGYADGTVSAPTAQGQRVVITLAEGPLGRHLIAVVS